jgi:hypothetical protein
MSLFKGISLLSLLAVMALPIGIARSAAPVSTGGTTTVAIRLINASPNSVSLDLMLDGQPSSLEHIEYGRVSQYIRLAGGRHTVSVTQTDTEAPELAAFTGELSAGTSATLVYLSSGASLWRLDDPPSPTVPDFANVRFVNLTHAATPFDLWVDHGLVSKFSGVPALAFSPYVPIDRYPHWFAVYPTGAYNPVTGFVQHQLNPGSGYSVFVMGTLSENPASLMLVIARDR